MKSVEIPSECVKAQLPWEFLPNLNPACDECGMRQLQHVLTADQQPLAQSTLGQLCFPCTHTLLYSVVSLHNKCYFLIK